MTWKTIAIAAAALAAGCDSRPAAPVRNEAAAETPEAPAAPAEPVQRRFDETMSGQPLTRPPTPFQLVVTTLRLNPRHPIPCHRHTYPRYVYIQQGNLRVTNHDTGKVYNFATGDIAVESIGQWHEGLVTSTGLTILVAFEQVPPGEGNSTPCPPKPTP
ncbi:MAG TPA: cupin domain-containing protein [Allosphingosinicella sp.]|nr:cupin domain-containing protein [Allosphingosinicella sp.]